MPATRQHALAIIAILLILRRRRRQREGRCRRRKIWVRSWISRRDKYGCFNALQRELEMEDPKAYKNFLRMDKESFTELLHKVSPLIERASTNMRQPISAAERLSVTLRYLATGNKYQDLEYLYRIPICTLSLIIPETCQAIYNVLKDDYMKMPCTEEQWRTIAEGFKKEWNFPNCVGAMDGKHVRIRPPAHSGSYYYNYKNNFSIVLLALIDADYKFTFVDVGVNGRVSDGGIFRQCDLKHALESNTLNIPQPQCLPHRNKKVPFVIVADAAFPLKNYLMKPYPFRGLDLRKRIFNYRLSRARRISENAFGILSNRFRVYDTIISLHPDKVENIVLATCALHNFLRTKSNSRVLYTPPGSLDRESRNHEIIDGDWRLRPSPAGVVNLAQQLGNRVSNNAKLIQEEFMEYFNNEGDIPWQWRLA